LANSYCQREFDSLISDVRQCRLCPRMSNSERVLSRAAGMPGAQVMFLGEAPGRLGADDSGIPFHGDKTGQNFESLLAHVGMSRYQVFVSNAVLCNPRDERGNNATPTRQEVENCTTFLERQITVVDPAIIVTLGATALQALKTIEPHKITLAEGVRHAFPWFGRILIPAYHPGQRAQIHRSFANQRSDFQFIAEQSRRLRGTRRATAGTPRSDVLSVLR